MRLLPVYSNYCRLPVPYLRLWPSVTACSVIPARPQLFLQSAEAIVKPKYAITLVLLPLPPWLVLMIVILVMPILRAHCEEPREVLQG